MDAHILDVDILGDVRALPSNFLLSVTLKLFVEVLRETGEFFKSHRLCFAKSKLFGKFNVLNNRVEGDEPKLVLILFAFATK